MLTIRAKINKMTLNIIIIPNKFTQALRNLAVVPDRQVPLFESQPSSSRTPKTQPVKELTNLRLEITPPFPIFP
jgi:hypothetical protein